MVVAIGSQIEIAAPLSTDRRAQQDAVKRLESWGTTGLHDAIISSIDAIQAAKGRRALLLLSDGNDRYSQASAADARDRARRSDVMVYPIALGNTRPPLFAELAALTGGRSFQPKDAPQMNATMETIATELRQQYLLGYVPSTPIVAGRRAVARHYCPREATRRHRSSARWISGKVMTERDAGPARAIRTVFGFRIPRPAPRHLPPSSTLSINPSSPVAINLRRRPAYG